MENKRYRKAQNHGVLLAISWQLLQRGLINQSEHEKLQQVLKEQYDLAISHVKDDSTVLKRQTKKKGGYRETE